MADDAAGEIIATIRREIEEAADVMLASVEAGLEQVTAAREGDDAALDRIQQSLFAILEACAFQDLTGQRLTKLRDMLSATSFEAVEADPLLNGPALAGQGLDQASADALLGAAGAWDRGAKP
ncbi:MAG: chemotaxis regulatin CheY-phosphate phosphatase CheZ [Brevundimonas sp.]|jgi:chemotaxis regulatin CheY-phosphate phosphatase CheZ|uniref:hypothetical protein n=1 Tax=Brevundimonas sp. TaxID=1871086 RepID=UPI00248A482C|nr:hypothetical protein [Brevundimonas sp.]MDI1281818.1 hypothetical protein [Brevundimonas sp.]